MNSETFKQATRLFNDLCELADAEVAIRLAASGIDDEVRELVRDLIRTDREDTKPVGWHAKISRRTRFGIHDAALKYGLVQLRRIAEIDPSR